MGTIQIDRILYSEELFQEAFEEQFEGGPAIAPEGAGSAALSEVLCRVLDNQLNPGVLEAYHCSCALKVDSARRQLDLLANMASLAQVAGLAETAESFVSQVEQSLELVREFLRFPSTELLNRALLLLEISHAQVKPLFCPRTMDGGV